MRWQYAGVVLILLLMSSRMAWAQPTPEEQLVLQANTLYSQRQYGKAIELYRQLLTRAPHGAGRDQVYYFLAQSQLALGQSAEAIEAFEMLQRDYPESGFTPDGLIALIRLYGQQPATWPLARSHRDHVVRQWPGTGFAWQAADAWYQAVVSTNPEQAWADLQALLAGNNLPPDALRKGSQLRLATLERQAPSLFLSEALKLVDTLAPTAEVADAQCLAQLAGRLYPLLIAAKRFDEARTLSIYTQRALERADDRSAWAIADRQAYLKALQPVNAAQFQSEAVAMLAEAGNNGTPAAARMACAVAEILYPYLIQAGRLREALQVHEQVQQLIDQPETGVAATADRLAYLGVRLDYLARTTPAQYQQEALGILARVERSESLAEFSYAVQLAGTLYAPLLRDGKLTEAYTLHRRLQTVAARMGLSTPQQQADVRALLNAVQTVSPERYPDEVIDRALGITAETPTGEVLALYAAALPLYSALYTAGKADRASALHTKLARALTQLQQTPEASAEASAYQTARLAYLEKADPQQFITEALALVSASATVRTPQAEATAIHALLRLAEYYDGLHTAEGSAQALTVYSRLVAVKPTDTRVPGWRLRQGLCLERVGRVAEATATYEALVKAYPDTVIAASALRRLAQLAVAK